MGEVQTKLGPFRLGPLALDYQTLPNDIRLVWSLLGQIISKILCTDSQQIQKLRTEDPNTGPTS